MTLSRRPTRPPRPTAALGLALCLGLSVAACGDGGGDGGGDGDGSGEGEPSSTAAAERSATSSPAAQPTARPVPALTFVKQPGDGADETCYALGQDDPAEVAWYASAVNVSASGRLTDVQAVDSTGVSVVVEDTQQVPLAGRSGRVGGIGSWPLTGDQVGRFIVVRDASDLVGTDLRANQTLLPVVHLTAQRDSSVEELVFTYELSNGQISETTYPAALRFARSCGQGGDGGSDGNGGGEED